jgi:hypothetical protein
MDAFIGTSFHTCFESRPITLVDIGASGGLPMHWLAARRSCWIPPLRPEVVSLEELYGYFDYAAELFEEHRELFAEHERLAFQRFLSSTIPISSRLPCFPGRRRLVGFSRSLIPIPRPSRDVWRTGTPVLGNRDPMLYGNPVDVHYDWAGWRLAGALSLGTSGLVRSRRWRPRPATPAPSRIR